MAITQSSSPDKSIKPQKKKRRALASVWLIMALLTGAAALAIWMFSSAPVFEDVSEKEQEQPAEVAAFNIAQVTQIDNLHELDQDVQPISFDNLVKDLRDYPPEFKDSRYLKKNKGKWTLQVMDVSEHEIITDYLSSRKDRNKFAYFRYRDESDQPHYILTYGSMNSESSATGTASSMDFGLPSNVKVAPKQFASYLDVIENYELSAPIKDLSSNRTRQVKLQPTKRELAARQRAKAAQDANQDKQSTGNESSTSPNPTTSTEEQRVEPSSTNTNIKGSNNTDDTLSVTEERKIVAPDNNGGDKPSSSAASSNQTSAKPKTSEPETNKSQSNRSPSGTTKPPPANNGSDVDKIKELINEKTQ